MLFLTPRDCCGYIRAAVNRRESAVEDAAPRPTRRCHRETHSVVCSCLVVDGCAACGATPVVAPAAAISLGSPYSQNFNSLANTRTTNAWTDDSTISGWYAAADNVTVSTYRAGTGSDNAGAIYSFGSSGNSERALGSAASGTPGGLYYGVRFVNDTGQTVSSVTISYTGEQWRNGGNTTAQKLTFSYQIGATSLKAGSWPGQPVRISRAKLPARFEHRSSTRW